jgi:hypothetical protein
MVRHMAELSLCRDFERLLRRKQNVAEDALGNLLCTVKASPAALAWLVAVRRHNIWHYCPACSPQGP